MIASLIHAGARLDRDENHVKIKDFILSSNKYSSFQPSAFYDKLFHNLSIVIINQLRQSPDYPNSSV